MTTTDCGFSDGSFQSGADLLVQLGPTLLVNIGLDPEYNYAETGVALNSDATQVKALVDTGAISSCIDDDLAQSLGLPLVNRQTMISLSGQSDVNLYLAHVPIPALSFFQRGVFYGCSINKATWNYRAVLGRTFLRDMTLIYDGPTGSVRIARQPSAAKSPHADATPQQDEAGPEDVTRR